MELKSKFSKNFSLSNESIQIKFATIDELMELWRALSREPQEKVTCRPVTHRNFEEEKAFYTKLLEDESICLFVITIGGEQIGKISLFNYNPRNSSVELGYSLKPNYRGRHYMSSSLKMLLRFLFCNIEINKIYAQTASFNTESINMLRSLSFSCDAHLRQHHELDGILYDDCIYSLIRRDYIIKNGDDQHVIS